MILQEKIGQRRIAGPLHSAILLGLCCLIGCSKPPETPSLSDPQSPSASETSRSLPSDEPISTYLAGTVWPPSEPAGSATCEEWLLPAAVYLVNAPKNSFKEHDVAGVRLHFRGGKIVPAMSCVAVGQPVTISAEDEQDHSVHVHSRHNPYGRILPPDSRNHTEKFNKPDDFVKLTCDLHAVEYGYLTVAPNHYCTVTNADRTFRLPLPVPPGTYHLRACQPAWGRAEANVKVDADGKYSAIEIRFPDRGKKPTARQ